MEKKCWNQQKWKLTENLNSKRVETDRKHMKTNKIKALTNGKREKMWKLREIIKWKQTET